VTEFGILGPLEVIHAGEAVRLGGTRQRAVLARLLLDAGRVIAADRLIEDVWDGRPPATAHKTLQKYVSELRKLLPGGVLRTTGGGYVLDIDCARLDACRFEQLVAAGESRAALALWRGDVLADLLDIGFAMPERVRLSDLRLAALEACYADELEQGNHAAVVPGLADAAKAHPTRERLTALHMLALYRSGRQVEALRAFEQHRQRLAEEVGIEPAPELRRLEAQILRQDPALDLQGQRLSAHEPERAAPADVGNLPLALTPFVGRGHELDATRRALHEHRLVTLTGPGGVGKTRLALEVAAARSCEHRGGTWLVDLAAVRTPDLVVDAVASVLFIEGGEADDLAALVEALAHRPSTLIVLDNCEHQVEACASLITVLLRAAPDVRVLATSRRPLGVDGEFVRPVAPLTIDESVALFTNRARLAGAAESGDLGAAAAEICRRIDGLPLAIELVASQLRVLDIGELAERLHAPLRFRGSAVTTPTRQRTLGEAIRWSHDLLPAGAQEVFSRLGVFCSSLTLPAAEAVCAATGIDAPDVFDHVTTLVDHSLLAREPAPRDTTRYRLLETLRLFALERLSEKNVEAATRRAHASFFLELAQESHDHLHGPDELVWRQRLECEEPNLHAALSWSAEHDPELSLRLAVALWPYWDVRWSERHAVAHLEGLLGRSDVQVDELLRAWGLAALGELAANPGEARRSARWAEEAVATFRRVGDDAGLARSLFALGLAYANGGRFGDADAALAEGVHLARRLGDDVLLARSLNATSFVATRRGDYGLAVELTREEVARWTALRSPRGEATGLRHLAVALQYVGELDQAEELCHRAMAVWERLGDAAAMAHVRLTLADIARLRGDAGRAERTYDDALSGFRAIGDRRCTASTFNNLARLAASAGRHEDSVGLYREGIALRHDLGDDAGLAECFEGLAGSVAALGRLEQAAALLTSATAIRDATGARASDAQQAATTALLESARAHLGDQQFAAAIADAPGCDVNAAVELALGR
jgi:predicted ATPase/DNA-binding SARP family transcriptional activator